MRESYFREARRLARELEAAAEPEFQQDAADIEGLKYFYYADRT